VPPGGKRHARLRTGPSISGQKVFIRCAHGLGDTIQFIRYASLATARVMRGLDLMVSVDSMPAHLAGALGVPV
jgi:ADP-heptose:LPS heptosyltransferase